MKKLLEVLQYGNGEIRFDTEVDVTKDLSVIHKITLGSMLGMVTKLWGGNEVSVLAIIRALAIADLSVSVNRKEMIKSLDFASEHYEEVFRETRNELVREGKATVFGPGVKPKMKN